MAQKENDILILGRLWSTSTNKVIADVEQIEGLNDKVDEKINTKLKDLAMSSTGSTYKTITALSQDNGKIYATYQDISFPSAKFGVARLKVASFDGEDFSNKPSYYLYALCTNDDTSLMPMLYAYKVGEGPAPYNNGLIQRSGSYYNLLDYHGGVVYECEISQVDYSYSLPSAYDYTDFFFPGT